MNWFTLFAWIVMGVLWVWWLLAVILAAPWRGRLVDATRWEKWNYRHFGEG